MPTIAITTSGAVQANVLASMSRAWNAAHSNNEQTGRTTKQARRGSRHIALKRNRRCDMGNKDVKPIASA